MSDVLSPPRFAVRSERCRAVEPDPWLPTMTLLIGLSARRGVIAPIGQELAEGHTSVRYSGSGEATRSVGGARGATPTSSATTNVKASSTRTSHERSF